MELKEYIDLKLVHSVHTSGRKSFRSCRRRWYWTTVEMYYPRTTPAPLEFGVAFHAAMEKFYDPMTWHQDIKVKQSLAMMQFKMACDEQIKNYKRMNGELELEKKEEYENRLTLGLHMIKYYTENVSRYTDVGFTPVEVELPFEIAILSPEGEAIWCKCRHCKRKWKKYQGAEEVTDAYWEQWQGLPVTYGGRLDMLAIDELGRYHIFDWKPETVDSPVLTPDRGWIRMGDVKVGDFVIGSNGKATRVTGVYPKGEMEVYEIEFHDKTVVECSKDHAWYVKDYYGKFHIKESQQMMKGKYAVPLPSAPVEFDKQDTPLPMHPYILGSLIGDGYFGGNTIAYASKSGETVDLLKHFATDDVDIRDNRETNGTRWVIRGPWMNQLKELGLWGKLSGDKFIPKQYLFASVPERIKLLQGLADTDGNTGLLRITTTSKQLADDIRHLIWSLGGTASLNSSKERLHQNGTTINVEQYGINYWVPNWIEPNLLVRKRVGRVERTKGLHRGIKEVRATGRMAQMQCIRVEADDHLYMTNNFVLTHNTTSRILDEDAESSFLTLDDQVASYLWALRSLGLDVVSFVYVEIRKAFPSPPKELSRLYRGRKYSTSKTEFSTAEQYMLFVSEHDPLAYAQGLYDEHIGWLKSEGPKFHQRHQIHKNDAEIAMAGYNIWLEALDMTQNPRIYPQPGRFSCNTCLFKQPCIGMNQGEDWRYTLDSMFDKQEFHYYELVDMAQEKKKSTEKRPE